MQIHKIGFLPQNYTLLNKKSDSHQVAKENYSYNPIAYKDYGINFGARLFRTPENFYAQPFNKNGMPDTMKEYLNADYEDRQKMPPAQMLKLVFDDINEAKNLEQVKRIYSGQPGYNPKESLFENLTDTPNKKARTGVLAEIDLMREDGKTLFKNGKDNLGLYILKKIYTEAKTLKEINEDFKKDISVHYEGLSPIGYDTLRAYGIKFPNLAFWKSLTATREEFPYTYKPRKPIERVGNLSVKHPTTHSTVQQKKRFENVKDWEVDKLADALGKGHGSAEETKKQLKKSSVRDEASLNFVAKYMGEINSVVLEKLHVSPEMKDFFENYDNLSKSQKQKFTAYWQDPERRELRSTIMKDTIKLFFEAYGVDGQNEEFQDLLNYAYSIKPNRIMAMEEHNKKQAYYDEMFAELDKQEKTNTETVKPQKTVDEILEAAKSQNGAETFTFNTAKGRIVIVANLKSALDESIRAQLNFMPEQFVNGFVRFVKSNPIADDSYILSKLLSEKGITLPPDDRLITDEEVIQRTEKLYYEFATNKKIITRALKQAIVDGFIHFSNEDISQNVFKLGLYEFATLNEELPEDIKAKLKAEKNNINDRYNEYKRPLSDSEARKIGIAVNELLRNYDLSKSSFIDNENYKLFVPVYYSVSKYINNKKLAKTVFKENLIEYIKSYGGSARFFIDKNVGADLKQAKLEHFLLEYCHERPGQLLSYAAFDKEGLEYIKIHAPAVYTALKNALPKNFEWDNFLKNYS